MLSRGFLPAALAATILLAGCGSAGQQSGTAANSSAKTAAGASTAPTNGKAAAGASTAPTKLQILYSTSSVDEIPEWAAQDGGYFQRNGLQVDLQYVGGGTKTIGALLSGQSQISIQGGDEAMSAVAGGADLVLIASLLPVYAFKLEAAQGINSVEDLKGKKLGVSTIGGTADVALRTFLAKHGINPDKDLTIVATGDPATSQAALRSGAVRASLSVPPNSLKAEASGTHPIADLATDRIPNAQNSVTVQRAWLNANRATAQKLVDSLVQGLARVKQDKPFTEQLMKKYLKYDDQKGLDYTYDFFVNEVWPDYPHVGADQLSTGLDELSKKNAKLKSFDPTSMLDDSFVQNAEKRGLAKQG